MRFAAPTVTKVHHSFRLGSKHKFHIEGTNFDTATSVHLTDNTAAGVTWTPQMVPQASFTKQTATVLEFVAAPDSTPRADAAGKLTITVTNPTGTSPSSTPVANADALYFAPVT